jgi:hypothetical protein
MTATVATNKADSASQEINLDESAARIRLATCFDTGPSLTPAGAGHSLLVHVLDFAPPSFIMINTRTRFVCNRAASRRDPRPQ